MAELPVGGSLGLVCFYKTKKHKIIISCDWFSKLIQCKLILASLRQGGGFFRALHGKRRREFPFFDANYLTDKSKFEIADDQWSPLRRECEHCTINWDLSGRLNFLFVLRARFFTSLTLVREWRAGSLFFNTSRTVCVRDFKFDLSVR